MASAACASASTRLASIDPPVRVPRMEMNSRIGITARSWASRMEKLARPAVVVRRRWLESTSMTIAVDDKARQAPMMTDAAAPLPNSAARPPITPVDSTTCRLPRPNTSRRMVSRRSIGQLQADQEQQEDDAELGDPRRRSWRR